MKTLISVIALLTLVSCGNSTENNSSTPVKMMTKSTLSSTPETWSIRSERALPAQVKVVINELEFINECTGLGRANFERNKKNGAIHIASFSTFRHEYFDISITNCKDGSEFFSQKYVDQFVIEHPHTGEVSVILSLKNY